ncbi:MAG: hypothetical protein Kow006_09790 [Gammaproteobacteria bacterium]
MPNRFDFPGSRFNEVIVSLVLVSGSLFMGSDTVGAATTKLGEETYKQVCIGCHLMGVLGAPKHQDAAEWKKRYAKGEEVLVQNALKGVGKMPPKGGNPNVTEEAIRAAIRYMAGAASGGASKPVSASTGKDVSGARTTAAGDAGKSVVDRVCKGCHEVGILGAPKIGVVEDWEPRLKKGENVLVDNAEKGIGSMPPKGGDASLDRDALLAAIRYMSRKPTPKIQVASATKKPAGKSAPKRSGTRVAEKKTTISRVNRFNRLMTPPSERNPPPAKDGIHDPQNPGTQVLQPPKEAFDLLPKGQSGNYVDWVRAFSEGLIEPRYDRLDPTKKPIVMDLNIVREVKGSMPDVVYPHKPHLEWLDCSNCHPAIFEPKKGANSISMAEILLGKKCGVCHGRVAFPVSECRRCHSKKKTTKAAAR